MALHPTSNINFYDIFGAVPGSTNLSIADLYTRSDDSTVPRSGSVGLGNISGRATKYNPAVDFTGTINYRSYYSSVGVTAVMSQPYTFDWGNNGTYLYVARNSELHRYTCSTAYDSSTLTIGTRQVYALPTTAATGDTGITYTYFATRGVTINGDGTKIILSNFDASGGYYYVLTLGTPWDISVNVSGARDLSQARIGAYWVEANGGATSNTSVTRTGTVQWYSSGSKFMATSSDGYLEVRNCPTPYTLVGSTRISIWNSSYGGSANETTSLYNGGINDGLGGCAFSDDGYNFWVMGNIAYLETASLYKFTLATAWDPRTATSRDRSVSFWTTPYLSSSDIWINPAATRINWVYVQGSGGWLVERDR